MTPLSQSNPVFRLGAVLLAAGGSTRMGRPKLLLPWGPTTVLGHLLEQWRVLGAEQVAVVVAAKDLTLEPELNRLRVPAADRIPNPAPQEGMFSSVRCAARWTGWEGSLTHWALCLGDQPHLKEDTLRALLEFARAHPLQVCQPAYRGRPRHPVLLPRPAFVALATARVPDLKAFLQPQTVALHESDDAGLELDIDRPEDYRQALALAGLGYRKW